MTKAFDRAQELEAAERDSCIAQQRAKPAMQATGFCLDPACGAPLPDGQLFCGAECRDFYEKQERMKLITGKK
jgi:hypothetical protein